MIRLRAARALRHLGPVLVAAAVFGCATMPRGATYRELGDTYYELWFKALPETPALDRVILIDTLIVQVVSDRKDFAWKRAAAEESRIAGFATPDNRIGILGKKIGRGIEVNQFLLGHEMAHVLNFNDPDIVDPHDRKTLEYCIGKKLEPSCDPKALAP